ncbi:substrate-binding domain-containing protein [uncultured Thomasclavelia sp.]|uniref:LacI family DNA-binding transcriptional regulator n=1 Tax=uncultured Thomasclavelia sp. TaxID=3025759 RepID=UPI0026007E35|nr:substrate-binding domain-containing protein [uncultured Thomasclavelia sp.]
MKLTISQIAKMAGVSRGTVDRVLHHRGNVSKETKQKILSIIEKYDYQPNAIGSALARKKSYKIGVILLEKHNSFFQIIKNGALEAVKTYKDYHIELEIRHIPYLEVKDYIKALNELEPIVDALALVGLDNEIVLEKVNSLVQQKIPIMTMNTDLSNSLRTGFIGIDDYKGGMCIGGLIKDILKENSTILLLSGDSIIRSQQSRLEGFKQVLKSYPSIYLSDVFYTHDKINEVYRYIYDTLSKKSYDAIVSMGSHVDMIVKAIKDLNLSNKPYILGFDLMPEYHDALANGEIDYIVDQNAFLQGYQTITCLCEYLIHKKQLPQGPQYLPIHIYNQYNI